jgi:hypothetical protein
MKRGWLYRLDCLPREDTHYLCSHSHTDINKTRGVTQTLPQIPRMGVKGLSTFLKDHRHKLSYTLELKSTDLTTPDAIAHDIHLVVDGWS